MWAPARPKNTADTRSRVRPARWKASTVLAKVGSAGSPAMAAISARCSAVARSKAGRKWSGVTRSNGGSPNGVAQSSSSGLEVAPSDLPVCRVLTNRLLLALSTTALYTCPRTGSHRG